MKKATAPWPDFMRTHYPATTPLLVLLTVVAACTGSDPYPVEPTPTISPTTISDARLEKDAAEGTIVLHWTAPRCGGTALRIVRYDIRYSLDLDFDWESATPVVDPPLPGPPGTAQEYDFSRVPGGRIVRAAIRSSDDSGYTSRTSNVADGVTPGHELSGRIVDALSGAPRPDVALNIQTDWRDLSAKIEADGEYRLSDLPSGEITLSIDADPGAALFFPVSHTFTLLDDRSDDYYLIAYGRATISNTLSILGLLKLAARSPAVARWTDLPVPVYIEPFVGATGLDYEASALSALDRWEEATGIDFFEPVDVEPERGIAILALPRSQMDGFIAYTEHSDPTAGVPEKSVVRVIDEVTNELTLYKILLHETGHTIRLGHLPSGYLMYGGQPLPADITADEITIVRILYSLPNGTDLSIYEEVDGE